jgi:hypothetical protein
MPNASVAPLAEYVAALARAGDSGRGLPVLIDLLGRDLRAKRIALEFVETDVPTLVWPANAGTVPPTAKSASMTATTHSSTKWRTSSPSRSIGMPIFTIWNAN